MWNHVYNLIELIRAGTFIIGPAATALPLRSAHLHFRHFPKALQDLSCRLLAVLCTCARSLTLIDCISIQLRSARHLPPSLYHSFMRH